MSWFDFSLQTKQENLGKKVQELENRVSILDTPPSNEHTCTREQAQQTKCQYEMLIGPSV